MANVIRIGTRESQLAVWQAANVKHQLAQQGVMSKLVYIKSEGDTNLHTPLYEIGVQGIFTKALDIALLNDEIDIAVHSMKDVPTIMAKGVVQAAVLPRASYKDILVLKEGVTFPGSSPQNVIATSSIRRKAQWLNRYPDDRVENLRGNVNTRLRKVKESNWTGAIFAAAGLERINLRPDNAVELDWMLPAPAQGAIIVICRENDKYSFDASALLNDEHTALCTHIERDFLRMLLGGCSTPISAFAKVEDGEVIFKGNILSKDGTQKKEITKKAPIGKAAKLGQESAKELLQNGGQIILDGIRNEK
jgi:hydroxymethylbilane synthase